MKRVAVYFIALMLAVLLSYAVGANAQKSGVRAASSAYAIPLVLTSADSRYEPTCDGIVLADQTFWPGVGERTYTARFTAIRGGTVRLMVGGNATSIQIPADEISRDYELPIVVNWLDPVSTEVKLEAQTTPGGCPQSRMFLWAVQIDVTP